MLGRFIAWICIVRQQPTRFREKYDPEYKEITTAYTKKIYEKNYEIFILDLAQGKFDGICFDQPSAGTIVTNGGSATDAPADEDTKMEEDEEMEEGEEVAPSRTVTSNAVSSSLESDPVDTAIRTPADDSTPEDIRTKSPILLIKSIPTFVTREMLEEVCMRDAIREER